MILDAAKIPITYPTKQRFVILEKKPSKECLETYMLFIVNEVWCLPFNFVP